MVQIRTGPVQPGLDLAKILYLFLFENWLFLIFVPLYKNKLRIQEQCGGNV